MKNHIILSVLFLSLFSYAQKSIFSELNKKGMGTFEVNGQLFFIDQFSVYGTTEKNNSITKNATSLALTFHYESPKIKNFSLTLSFLRSIRFQQYSSEFDNAAEIVQNESFGILNNASINYHLRSFGIKEGFISLGRFPLYTEFMTTYKIRQKEQAYEGLLVNLPDIGNWSFILGYLSKFSSWRSNPNEFIPISTIYNGDEGVNEGQEFIEASYKGSKGWVSLSTYYIKANNLWDTLGISYLQKLTIRDNGINLSIRSKDIIQWSSGTNSINEIVAGFQSGILITNKKWSVEGGIFLVTGKTTNENTSLQNPFGAKLILSEPLLGTGSSFNKKSKSYYIESTYRYNKGKIYLLYLKTDDSQQNTIVDELNLITSYKLNKSLKTSVKIGFLNENTSNSNQQVLDIRLVMNYTF